MIFTIFYFQLSHKYVSNISSVLRSFFAEHSMYWMSFSWQSFIISASYTCLSFTKSHLLPTKIFTDYAGEFSWAKLNQVYLIATKLSQLVRSKTKATFFHTKIRIIYKQIIFIVNNQNYSLKNLFLQLLSFEFNLKSFINRTEGSKP